MPDIEIGAPASGGSPIPVKWLLLGGGGLLVAFLFMRGKSGGGGGESDVAGEGSVYGSALGPNAALALGGLQTQVMQESGYLQELFTKQAQMLGDQSEAQYTDILDAIFSGDQDVISTLGGASQSGFQRLLDAIAAGDSNLVNVIRNTEFNLSADVRGQALNIMNQDASPEARRFNTWTYARSLATTPARESYYREWLRQAGIDFDTGDPWAES